MDNINRDKAMDFKDVIRNTVDVYRKNFLRLIIAFGILFLPLNIILSIIMSNIMPYYNKLLNVIQKHPNNSEILTNAADKFQEQIRGSAGPLGITILISLFAAFICLPAVFRIASEAFKGNALSVGSAYGFSLRKCFKYAITMILFVILIIFLSIVIAIAALIVFGILFFLLSFMGGAIANIFGQIFEQVGTLILSAYIFGLFSFITVAVSVEEKNPLEAIKRGFSITGFKFMRFIGVTVLGLLLITVLSIIVAELGIAISNATGVFVIQHVISTVGGIIFMPMLFVLMIVLYYDYKANSEEADIEQSYSEL